MDPSKRTLLKVEIEDAELADKAFVELMGDDVHTKNTSKQMQLRSKFRYLIPPLL